MVQKMWFAAVAAVVAMVFGCAGSRSDSVGKETQVDQSAKERPAWLGQSSKMVGKEPKDTLWTVGMTDKVVELDAGIEAANASAKGWILDFIQTDAVRLLEAGYSGKTSAKGGRFLDYAVAWRSKVNGLSGVTTPEVYWERWEQQQSGDRVEYFYRVFAHSALSGEDYRAVMRTALEGIADVAQSRNDVEARDFAKKAMSELKAR